MSEKNIKYFVLLSGILLFTIACRQKEGEDLNFNDLAPGSEKYQENKKQQEKKGEANVAYYDSLSPYSQTFIDSLGWGSAQVEALAVNLLPDRFKVKSKEKWCIKSETDSLVFATWLFADSVQALNAFYNWLDCFGSSCKNIKIGGTAKMGKRSNLLFIQEARITWIESDGVIPVEARLKQCDGQEKTRPIRYILIGQPRKNTTWMKRDKTGQLLVYSE